MAHQRITVTQLKCAVLDPKWRKRWLAGEAPSTFFFSQNGKGSVFGTQFHQETERLTKWLTSASHVRKAAAIDSVDELLDIAWRSSLQNFTDELLAKGKPEDAMAFTERIRSFCGRLIELRRRIKKFENWQDVFIATEQSLEDIHVPVGDTTVEIAARVDAIRFHPKFHLEVVDYKLSQGAQQKSDLVQLAVYAHLLPFWRPGCEFCGTLEYYLPEFMEVNISTQELADIYASLVAPVLLEMFAPEVKSPARKTNVSGQSELAADIVEAFRAFDLGVEAVGVVEGPQVTRIKLKPSAGVKVASLANRAADLQIALSLDEPPLIKPGRGFVVIDLPRTDRQTILLLDYLKNVLVGESKKPMAFPVGVGVEGEAILSDFCDSNTCHVLVAGTSGSGKSEWLKSLVASLTFRNPPERVRLALVDPKILTFSTVEASPYLWRPVATDIESALAVLDAAVAEMENRYKALAKQGFVSIADRFQAGLFDVPFLVLVFDEFADLILTGRNEKREFEEMVARLAGKGRAAGIHLVLATQRPDRTVVTGLIKSNLPMKVCLRVANATNSQIVLGESGAESLLGKGDLLCDMGRGVVRAQSYYVPQSDFAEALKV
jgi:FtsK/SpoIIIE family/FtsK alpha domain/PD-(D/E)XK nuclease superfamily